MSLEPDALVRLALLGLQGVMLVVTLLALPVQRRRPGMEFSVMIIALISLSLAGNLFADAVRSVRPPAEDWSPWINLGLLVFSMQTLFWTSLWELHRRDRAAGGPAPRTAANG